MEISMVQLINVMRMDELTTIVNRKFDSGAGLYYNWIALSDPAVETSEPLMFLTLSGTEGRSDRWDLPSLCMSCLWTYSTSWGIC